MIPDAETAAGSEFACPPEERRDGQSREPVISEFNDTYKSTLASSAVLHKSLAYV